eukprot:TRINITY_DN17561_c0_g1_i1.p1 TRINITY_DN17561_c0_g1~~TRINITY_DN17561_c0_g1_i1.p1  ORF type:complete len:549 (+),score=101.19 TRINITY_DN17561_c0_g1_i1:54-1700(+)
MMVVSAGKIELVVVWGLLLVCPTLVQSKLTHKDWLTLRTERAHVLSKYKHLVTSSTLSWAWIEDILSGQIPTSHLILVDGSSAVCRVRDGNRDRAGRTDLSGSCLAGPGYTKHSEYQVLVDLSRFSRHEWRYWDMFTMPIVGTVAYNTDKTYVASFQMAVDADTGGKDQQIIGELNTERGLNGNIKAYISETEIKLSTEGSVLVEIEPQKYIIDTVKLDDNKEKTTTKIINLGELWITREKDEPKNALFLSPEDSKPFDEEEDWDYIGARIDYTVNVSQNWGHMPGAIRGLHTESRQVEGQPTVAKFPWGTRWRGHLKDSVDVGVDLQPGTKILAKVQGVIKSGETPYSAVLTQIYADSVKKPVDIQGDLRHTSLADVRVRYIDRQYIDTGLPAPAKPAMDPNKQSQEQPNITNVKLDPSSHGDKDSDNGDDYDMGVVPLGTPMSMVSTTYSGSSNNSNNDDSGRGKKSTPELEGGATLYPPTQPTTAKPNPLRKFYPVEEEPARDLVMFSAAKYEDTNNDGVESSPRDISMIAVTLLLCLHRFFYTY